MTVYQALALAIAFASLMITIHRYKKPDINNHLLIVKVRARRTFLMSNGFQGAFLCPLKTTYD